MELANLIIWLIFSAGLFARFVSDSDRANFSTATDFLWLLAARLVCLDEEMFGVESVDCDASHDLRILCNSCCQLGSKIIYPTDPGQHCQAEELSARKGFFLQPY